MGELETDSDTKPKVACIGFTSSLRPHVHHRISARDLEDKLGSYFGGRDSTASYSNLSPSVFCCHWVDFKFRIAVLPSVSLRTHPEQRISFLNWRWIKFLHEMEEFSWFKHLSVIFWNTTRSWILLG
jgi:hypothetical protein